MKPRVAVWVILTLMVAIALLNAKRAIASPTADNVPIGRIIEIKGEVKLKRRNWREYRPTTVNTILYLGDLLQPAPGATVRVRCTADNNIWPVPAGQVSGANRFCELPPQLQPQRPDIDPPRGDGITIKHNIPYILSPRRTALLAGNPTLRWNAVPNANSYTVRVRGEGLDWEQKNVTSTSIVYSGEPLKPGVYYTAIVESNTGRFSLEEDTPGLGFKLLDENQQFSVKAAIEQLDKEQLNDEAKALAIVDIYLKNDLKAEVINILEILAINSNENALIYRTLADLYWQIKLPAMAELNYLKAIQLTANDDIDGQAKNFDDLGQLYVALRETKKATEYLNKALNQYEALGDLKRVAELKKYLEELANEK